MLYYPRRVSYNINGNTMVFHVGQEIRNKFRILQIKETFEGVNHFVDIHITPLKKNQSTRWKRIINGVSVIEYNVDFLIE